MAEVEHRGALADLDASAGGHGGGSPRGALPGVRRVSRWRARHPLLSFAVVRLAGAVVTLLVASVLIFAAVEILPGDAASNVLGREATPQRIDKLRTELGLNRPLLQRYGTWLNDAVHGSLGDSTVAVAQGDSQRRLTSLMAEPLRNSLILATFTTILFVPIGVALGVLAGVRVGKPTEHAISLGALTILSMPEFVLGILLIFLFSTTLGLLPPVSLVPPGTSPLDHPDILVLPGLTLAAVTGAAVVRMTRAGLADVLRQDYVAMARLNGFSERRVVWRFAVRNALATTVQIIAQNIQYLFGGIIIVESVFAYPGIGNMLINAIQSRDATAIQGIALTLAAIYVTINVLADFAVMLLVPKLRTPR